MVSGITLDRVVGKNSLPYWKGKRSLATEIVVECYLSFFFFSFEKKGGFFSGFEFF